MFVDKTVSQFLDELASPEPVPGGGSSAALGAALSAALISMVANLTVGKKGYEEVDEEMQSLLKRSEVLRQQVTDLLEEDTRVYGRVMACYRMPRKTDEQKAAREEAMQTALKEAAEVPLELAARCAEIVDLALPAAKMGNKWAVSDAGVGVLMAEACMHGALLNVFVNLASIKDREYVQRTLDRVEEITRDKSQIKNEVWEAVRTSIRG